MENKRLSKSNILKSSQKNIFNLLQKQHYDKFELYIEHQSINIIFNYRRSSNLSMQYRYFYII